MRLEMQVVTVATARRHVVGDDGLDVYETVELVDGDGNPTKVKRQVTEPSGQSLKLRQLGTGDGYQLKGDLNLTVSDPELFDQFERGTVVTLAIAEEL